MNSGNCPEEQVQGRGQLKGMKDETRDHMVKARLTKTEYEDFLTKVGASQDPGNMSGYIRACIFSEDLRHSTAVVRELKNMNYQIRKIGVLINQIAASANRGVMYRGDAELVLKKLQEVEELVKTFETHLE